MCCREQVADRSVASGMSYKDIASKMGKDEPYVLARE